MWVSLPPRKVIEGLDKKAAQSCVGQEHQGRVEPVIWSIAAVAGLRKIVSLKSSDIKELAKQSGMTTWSYNALMDHRKEVRSYKLRKVEDVRLDRLLSVG